MRERRSKPANGRPSGIAKRDDYKGRKTFLGAGSGRRPIGINAARRPLFQHLARNFGDPRLDRGWISATGYADFSLTLDDRLRECSAIGDEIDRCNAIVLYPKAERDAHFACL